MVSMALSASFAIKPWSAPFCHLARSTRPRSNEAIALGRSGAALSAQQREDGEPVPPSFSLPDVAQASCRLVARQYEGMGSSVIRLKNRLAPLSVKFWARSPAVASALGAQPTDARNFQLPLPARCFICHAGHRVLQADGVAINYLVLLAPERRAFASMAGRLQSSSIVQLVGSTPAAPNPSLVGTATGKALGPRAGQCHHPSRGPSAFPASALSSNVRRHFVHCTSWHSAIRHATGWRGAMRCIGPARCGRNLGACRFGPRVEPGTRLGVKLATLRRFAVLARRQGAGRHGTCRLTSGGKLAYRGSPVSLACAEYALAIRTGRFFSVAHPGAGFTGRAPDQLKVRIWVRRGASGRMLGSALLVGVHPCRSQS